MANWDSQGKRDKASADTFCGPNRTFPVSDAEDATHALSLAHHADNPAAVRACVMRKIKENHWDAGKSSDKAANSATVMFDLGDGETWQGATTLNIRTYPVGVASFAADAMSHAELHDRLGRALAVEHPGSYLHDVWPDHIVYSRPTAAENGVPDARIFSRSYTLDAETGVPTLGNNEQEVERSVNYRPVKKVTSMSFDGPATFSDDDMVSREGVIFKVGDYPDKNLSFTADDADRVVAAFKAVPLELEHFDTYGQRSILTGRLGQLTGIRRDGDYLRGTLRVPKWIDGIWGEAGRRVSAVIDTGSKLIERAGLVLEPRVSEAQVFSAFAAFAGARHSEADASLMQVAHDALTKTKAVTCDPANMPPTRGFSAGEKGEEIIMPETVDKAAFAAMQSKLAALEAQNRQLQAKDEIAAMARGVVSPDNFTAIATGLLATALGIDEQQERKAAFSVGSTQYTLGDGVRTLLRAAFSTFKPDTRFDDALVVPGYQPSSSPDDLYSDANVSAFLRQFESASKGSE